ncbi:hypothetical protein DMB66_24960 [Actinoplanes sp. ATCC 53533]|nr:hypothetical protein DMB66_24960 [Actinoplanes sp. ATCC 53533]
MTAGEGAPMKGWLWLALGLLGVVLGVLWTAQGLDLLGGSVMSGVTIWAVIGPIVAVGGLVLIVLGVRVRARSKQQP